MGGMPSFILKADPEADLYAEWSTVVDGPYFIGTRRQLLDHGIAEDRIARADATGTSILEKDYRFGEFGGHALIVLNGGMSKAGVLPRDRMLPYLTALLQESDERAGYKAGEALLDPLDDE